MADQPVHTKIINQVAREALRPIGVRQKGRSRLWYDDARWYTTVIEFQPSGWAQGTFLNIGIHWLWYPNEHWSFDLGHREFEFTEFETEDQFHAAVVSMAEVAAARVRDLRARLETLSGAFEYAEKKSRRVDWGGLHLGILAALCGDTSAARSFVSTAVIEATSVGWQADRNNYIRSLLDAMADPQHLREFLEIRIAESRKLLRLEENPGPYLPAR